MGCFQSKIVSTAAETGEPGKTLLSSSADLHKPQHDANSLGKNAAQEPAEEPNDANPSEKNTAQDPAEEPKPSQDLVSESNSDSDANRQKLALILKGLFQGLFEGSMPDVVDFIGDTHGALEHFHATALNFDQKTSSSAVKALEELAGGLEQVMSAMQAANSSRQAIEKLAAAIAIIHTPGALAFSVDAHVGAQLLIHGKDMFGHIESAVADYKMEKWEEFGKHLGTAIGEILAPVEPPTCCGFSPFGSCYPGY